MVVPSAVLTHQFAGCRREAQTGSEGSGCSQHQPRLRAETTCTHPRLQQKRPSCVPSSLRWTRGVTSSFLCTCPVTDLLTTVTDTLIPLVSTTPVWDGEPFPTLFFISVIAEEY